MRLIFAALVGVSVASSAMAQTAVSEKKGRDRSADRVICQEDNEIGSMLKKHKTCMTAAQWRELQFRTGSAIDRSSASVPKNGGG